MRRQDNLPDQALACPWAEFDLAPGLLRLFQAEARQWLRDAELADDTLAALLALTGWDHRVLRELTMQAVTSGRCRPCEGLTLLAATACQDSDLDTTLELADGAWWRECRFGSDPLGADEPGLSGIRLWPIRQIFPAEEVPPAWQDWESLANQAALGGAARAVLGHQMMLVFQRGDQAEDQA